MDIGALLLRLTVRLTLAAHGAQKLFGWFGGPGLDATGQFFEMLGFSPGRRHARMAGLAETGGGLLLALGCWRGLRLSRFAARRAISKKFGNAVPGPRYGIGARRKAKNECDDWQTNRTRCPAER
jgi:hypothetical protein